MSGFPSPFGSNDKDPFDSYDEFVPEHIPEAGRFLEDHDLLAGPGHVAFHRLTRDLFEERTVYDMTFNYNLARLNLDTRHGDAGYRYAAERSGAADAIGVEEIDRVLRAEFTPTTPFCPQSKSLTMGSYRAWNGEADRHEYDLVRVRVHPMHHRSESINAALADLEPDGVAPAAPDDQFESQTDPDHGRILRDRLDEERDSEPSDSVDLSAPF